MMGCNQMDNSTLIKIAKANRANPYVDITPYELGIGFPFIHYTGFFPESDETLIYAVPAQVFFDKEQIVAYNNRYVSGGVRMGSRTTLRSGKSQGSPVRSDVRKIHDGDLIITNKRIIFVGKDESFEFKTDKITTVKLLAKNSFVIQYGKTSKNIIVDPVLTAYTYGYINFVSQSSSAKEELFCNITAERAAISPEQLKQCEDVLAASQKIKLPKEKNANGCLWNIVKALFILLITVLIGGIIAIIIVSSQNGGETKTHAVESFVLSEYDSTDMSITIDDHDTLVIYVTPSNIETEDIELVVENPDVAKCLVQDVYNVAGKRLIKISYRGMAVGETTLYVKDKNSEKTSDVIHLTVIEKESPPEDNSRQVYITLTGDKYHYSKSCAGKNAGVSTLNKAQNLGKEPCSKCAH